METNEQNPAQPEEVLVDPWAAYESRWNKDKGWMQTVLMGALDPWGVHAELDNSGDDYGAVAKVEREDGSACYVELRLCDASGYGYEEPGVAGNYSLTGIGDGGLVLGHFVPHNFTDACWANYNDEQTWHVKRMSIEAVQGDVTKIIREFMEGASTP